MGALVLTYREAVPAPVGCTPGYAAVGLLSWPHLEANDTRCEPGSRRRLSAGGRWSWANRRPMAVVG